jgi:hypothetical protein
MVNLSPGIKTGVLSLSFIGIALAGYFIGMANVSQASIQPSPPRDPASRIQELGITDEQLGKITRINMTADGEIARVQQKIAGQEQLIHQLVMSPTSTREETMSKMKEIGQLNGEIGTIHISRLFQIRDLLGPEKQIQLMQAMEQQQQQMQPQQMQQMMQQQMQQQQMQKMQQQSSH